MYIYLQAGRERIPSNFAIDTDTGRFRYRFKKVWHDAKAIGVIDGFLAVSAPVTYSVGDVKNTVNVGGIALGLANTVNAGYDTPNLKTYYGFASGYGNNVTGFCATAIGSQNTVSGFSAFAVGVQNTVNQQAGIAMGQNLVVGNPGAVAFGKYNLDSAEFVLMIGQGEDEDTRLNVLTVDAMGNVEIGGYIKVTDVEIGNMSLVDELANIHTYCMQWAVTMPEASSGHEGIVLLYLGATTASFTSKHFYQCQKQGGNYLWVDLGGLGE